MLKSKISNVKNYIQKNMNSKLRVGVFIGGKTLEKEVSFNSGRTACDHLDTNKYEVIPIYQSSDNNLYILPWQFLYRGKTSDFENKLKNTAKKIIWDDLKTLIDFVYIASHGHFIEDGNLQGMFEVLKIPYLGSKVYSSAISMDKHFQKTILKTNKIQVPKSFSIFPENINKINQKYLAEEIKKNNLQFPLIVKPNKEGSSIGIKIVKNKNELLKSVIKTIKINPIQNQIAIVEEYIKGMEFSCIILTDHKTGNLIPLTPTEIVIEKNTEFFDYQQKYMPGKSLKFTPPRCSLKLIKKIQDTCIKVMKILEMENIARVDGFLTPKEEIVITDPNTLCGMAPSSFVFNQAAEAGMSHSQLINHLIKTEIQNYDSLKKLMNNNSTKSEKTYKSKIAVLFGGDSHEKETSLDSGRNIFYKLSNQKYQPIPIFVDSNLNLFKIDQSFIVKNSTKEIEHKLKPNMQIKWSELKEISDFVFIALHGGSGENGSIQGTLETLGLPYNGSSVLASSICIDKYKTNEFLKIFGFDVPKNKLISKELFNKNQTKIIESIEFLGSYPFIVKPHNDGCSILVNKAKNQNELIQSLEKIFKTGKNLALVEECIQGMELTVGVIGNEKITVMPPSYAIASSSVLSIEEKFLPGQGENQTPAPLTKEALSLVQNTIKKSYKKLNCKGYARIDCFYQNSKTSPTKKDRVVIIEVNTLPGMTPATCIFHQAAEIGFKPMEFIDLIIKLGFEEHKNQNSNINKPSKELELL